MIITIHMNSTPLESSFSVNFLSKARKFPSTPL
jgi:hypothetical protein